MNGKIFLQRLTNVGTIIGIASGVLLIATTLGYQVDNAEIMTIVKTICGIGVTLGILNNPDSIGLDLPGITNINNNNK